MKHVGYGVTQNDKPSGIWPVSLQQAIEARDRKRKTVVGPAARAQIQMVEVYMSGPIDPPPVAVLEIDPSKLA